MTLAFDATSHRYTFGGAELISVTQAIRDAGLMGDMSHFTDEARGRGTYVHQACEWLDQGDLDTDALDPALRPYVDAYDWFRHDYEPVWTCIEARRCDMVLRYAGTVDRAGTLKGRKFPVVLDIKSGTLAPWHRVQLAAYRHLLGQELGALVERAALYLSADGKYRLEHFALVDGPDWAVFQSALTLAQWKRGNL